MDSTRLRAPVTHRFKPVGACIYCGATQGRLTEEHIVPKGLGGTLVLPDSSCDPCAKLTSQFEMKVLRGFLDRGRQSLGIKGRKSHRRPATEPIKQTFIRADNSLVEHDLPWDQSVKVMHLPVLTLPGFLNPKFPPDPSAEGIEISAMDTLTMGLGEGEIVREHASVGMQFQDRMDICSFGCWPRLHTATRSRCTALFLLSKAHWCPSFLVSDGMREIGLVAQSRIRFHLIVSACTFSKTFH